MVGMVSELCKGIGEQGMFVTITNLLSSLPPLSLLPPSLPPPSLHPHVMGVLGGVYRDWWVGHVVGMVEELCEGIGEQGML